MLMVTPDMCYGQKKGFTRLSDFTSHVGGWSPILSFIGMHLLIMCGFPLGGLDDHKPLKIVSSFEETGNINITCTCTIYIHIPYTLYPSLSHSS